MKDLGRLLLTACVAGLLVPSTAAAVITSSNVTSPGDPYFALDDDDAPVPPTLDVSGTSNGTTGDLIDVTCSHDGPVGPILADNVAVSADGGFSATVPLDGLDDNACYLKGVPDGVFEDVQRFRGPRVAVSSTAIAGQVVGGPNDGLVYDYLINSEALRGNYDLRSLSGGALDDGGAYGLPAFDDESDAWNNGAAIAPRNYRGNGPRSGLVVDGANAYAPAGAVGLFAGAENNPGLQPTNYSQSLNTTNGEMTVTESADIVRCSDNTIPPTSLTCPAFVATGVRWERTLATRAGGRAVRVTDTLASADGAAHSIDVLVDNDFEESETGWWLPPFEEPMRLADSDVISGSDLPSAPFTMLAHEADDEPPTSLEAGWAGVTFAAKPDEIRASGEDRIEVAYALAVPAGGSAELKHSYSQTHTMSEGIALGQAAADEFAPPDKAGPATAAPDKAVPETTITKRPKKGKSRKARFLFTSSEPGSTFECKLDGQKFSSCESPRIYRNLKLRKHVFQVRAIDSAGNVDPTPAAARWKVLKRKR